MDDNIDETFAFLTFFKICKMYKDLKRCRPGSTGQRVTTLRKHSMASKPSGFHQRTTTKQNLEVGSYSQMQKKLAEKLSAKESATLCKNKSQPLLENVEVENEASFTSLVTSEKLLRRPPQEKDENHSGDDIKHEISITDWQVTAVQQQHPNQLKIQQKSTSMEHQNVEEELYETQDLIEELCDQVQDNANDLPSYDESLDDILHQNSEQISYEIDLEPPHIQQQIEEFKVEPIEVQGPRRRRRRRPGDPPLEPLPKTKKERQRQFKIRPSNLNRFKEGYFQKVFKKTKMQDEDHLLELIRMNRRSFDMLLQLLRKSMTKCRNIISVEEKLSITLLFLAHGMSFQYISDKYKLGKATVRFVVLETCEFLWKILSPLYMPEPSSEDYIEIADEFKSRWNLPNCVGAIAGKYVRFNNCRNYGNMTKLSDIKNLVLVAACDAKHKFRSISITVEPHHSSFYKSLINNTLPLPPGRPLNENATNDFAYYYIGDTAFPQRVNLMRPYGDDDDIDEQMTMYNYCISSGLSIVDNSFKILTSMWKVLLVEFSISIENWRSIVLACIVLHNFVMANETARWYQSDGNLKPDWSQNISDICNEWVNADNPLQYADHLESVFAFFGEDNNGGMESRDTLAAYFCNEEIP